MSSRTTRKEVVRQARVAAEERTRLLAQRQRRVRTVVGTALVAAALVAVAVAVSSGHGLRATAATGGKVFGATVSRNLFAGIPQRGTVLGRPGAPVKLVEFADLQCPYCDEYALQALPSLVTNYVRPGKLQLQFENLSFIGPDSVKAGRVAASAAEQNRLWNFIDLLYLNQGEENTGYVTPAYIRRLLGAVPGMNVSEALRASGTRTADTALTSANQIASRDGVSGTPTFFVGNAGTGLRLFQPASLTAAPFESEINSLLSAAP